MSNPTLNAGTQFNSPFNILPDVIYTNPSSQTSTQFNAPFNILPDVIYTTNPTFQGNTQFKAPFNILPDKLYKNPTIGYPQFISTQFLQPGYTGNPTNNSKFQTTVPLAAEPISTFTVNQFNRTLWNPLPAEASNITGESILANVVGGAASMLGGAIGVPQVAQSAQSVLQSTISPLSTQYATLQLDQLKPLVGVKYADFRNRRILGNAAAATKIRLDGASAAFRSPFGRSSLFAAASANPLGGAYAVFNLDGAGKTGFGWGSHGDPYAIRNDFTLRSHVATRWVGATSEWLPTLNPIELATPFRGDRVSVIDFSKRTEEDAYRWHPFKFLGALGKTNDFIKFYFTGPGVLPNGTGTDDIIVFRAIISSLSDSFNADWSPVTMIGRADPNYQYSGFTRDLSLSFDVYATDRDELKPIWRKLNALAGYTAPIYNSDITMAGPWMRITIGDIFRQTPVVLKSLQYTLHDTDTTWEINIEDDSTNMQVPHKVSVTCGFSVIGNELPTNNGRFYSLAKEYDNAGKAKKGNSNWLSDAKESSDLEVEPRWRVGRNKEQVTV